MTEAMKKQKKEQKEKEDQEKESENESEEFQSIVGNLFFGEIDEALVFPFPSFTPEQQEMIRGIVEPVRKFCQDHVKSDEFDEQEALPPEFIRGLAELGLMGLAVPEEYGGMNLDYCLYSRVMGEIASIDGATATFLGAHQSIGYRALLNEGTVEQKKKWLPQLASGEKIAAFCLTEPGAGSDAYSIKTKATKGEDGHYTINGQKIWITNAGMADFYTVFCKTEHIEPGDGGKGQKTKERISCFVVEKGTPGLSFGEKERKMGIRASETRCVYFDNVRVPPENLIGIPGKGFKIAMNVLNTGRLSLGSGCVGGMKRILELATSHAQNRKQFNKPIIEFGMIQEKLAQMAAHCYATESTVYMTTGNMVRGFKDFFLESTICKIYGSESLWKVINMGLQIAGGTGYMREYPFERIMRDARINLIFEGTNEILRCFLALLGIKAPSEKLKELGKVADVATALKDPIKSFGVLTDFAKNRIAKLISSNGLTKCHEDLENMSSQFSSLLSNFSIQVDNALIKHGKSIVDNEFPLERIANMAIELYVILCVLSRTTTILEDDSIARDKKDYVLNLTQIIVKNARQNFMSAFRGMAKNSDSQMVQVCKGLGKHQGHFLDIIDF